MKWNIKKSLWLQFKLKNQEILILPWSPQHGRVWCSTALAISQSSWEVNCNSSLGIQPLPPVPPAPLLLTAEVSQMEPRALRDADTHNPVLSLFYLNISLWFAEFPCWRRQLQARQVFALENHLCPLGMEKTKCISWLQQTGESSSYQKFSCDTSSTYGGKCLRAVLNSEPSLPGKVLCWQLNVWGRSSSQSGVSALLGIDLPAKLLLSLCENQTNVRPYKASSPLEVSSTLEEVVEIRVKA